MANINTLLIAVIGYFIYQLILGRGKMGQQGSYLQLSQGATMSNAEATEKATRLYNAMGWFDDDEEAIYAVFRQIPTYADLMLVGTKLLALYDYTLDMYVQKVNQAPYSTNDGTKKAINKILLSNNINYQF